MKDESEILVSLFILHPFKGDGPNLWIRSATSAAYWANCAPIADERLSISTRSPSRPIWLNHFLIVSTRLRALRLPAR
jgi:hypothetical protein